MDTNHIAIKLFNPKSRTKSIKIFTIDTLIAVASQYLEITQAADDQIATFFNYGLLQSKQLMLLQLLPGPTTNYLLCSTNQIHLAPTAVFNFLSTRTTSNTYSENVTVQLLTPDDLIEHDFGIGLSNLGQGISRGSNFPSRGTAVDAVEELVLDDSYWFKGTVYDYDFDCDDCHGRIQFRNKIRVESSEEVPF